MNLLHKSAERLYNVLSRNKKLVRRQVGIDLEHLYPEKSRDKSCRDFYVKKLEITMMIVIAGSALSACLAVRTIGERQLSQNNVLERGDVSQEEKQVRLEGIYDGRKEVFEIDVMPRQLTPDEKERWYDEFCEELPGLILGNNTSLQSVCTNLDLQEKYEGYPFYVEWKSQNADVLTSAGSIRPPKQDEEITLTANVSYGASEWIREFTVNVMAKETSAEEHLYEQLQELLAQTEKETRQEQSWSLPEQFGEYAIQWQYAREDNSLLIFAGTLIAGMLVYFMKDWDLHKDLEKQKEEMKREYPDIVHKLALYLGAGMTLQGAFQKIGSEYENRRNPGKKTSMGYEHVLHTCRELKSGVSEAQAYERFGKRTGLREYIRLSTLMTQNLKKGSASLLSRLQEEAQRAMAEQIQGGRRLGEEASTKLLVPMVMMLGVVMVMVILPAFGSIGL